jgi:hypothetical protein
VILFTEVQSSMLLAQASSSSETVKEIGKGMQLTVQWAPLHSGGCGGGQGEGFL